MRLWRHLAPEISLLVGAAVGLVPGLAATRGPLDGELRSGGRSLSDGRHRLRSALLITQLALTVTVLIGTGLTARSFASVLAVDPGFRAERLLTMQIAVPNRYLDRRPEFYGQLFAALDAVPGVVSSGGSTWLPLTGVDSRSEIATVDTALPRAVARRRLSTSPSPLLRRDGYVDPARPMHTKRQRLHEPEGLGRIVGPGAWGLGAGIWNA